MTGCGFTWLEGLLMAGNSLNGWNWVNFALNGLIAGQGKKG